MGTLRGKRVHVRLAGVAVWAVGMGLFGGSVGIDRSYAVPLPQGDLDARAGERTAAAASATARSEGVQVEVLSRRTREARVFAEPDGQFTTESRMEGGPVPRTSNRAPGVPTELAVSDRGAGGVVLESRPTFAVDVSDPEQSLVRAEFEIRRDGNVIGRGVTEDRSGDGRVRWNLAKSDVVALDSGIYQVRARAFDGHRASGWGPASTFTVDDSRARPHAPQVSPHDEVWWDEGAEIFMVTEKKIRLSAQVSSSDGAPVRALFRLRQTDDDTGEFTRLGSVVASGERSEVEVDAADFYDGYYRVRITTVDAALTDAAQASGRESRHADLWLRTLNGVELYGEDWEEDYEENYQPPTPTRFPGVDSEWLEDLQDWAEDEGRSIEDVVDEALWGDRYFSLVEELQAEYPGRISQVLGGDRRGRTAIWFVGDVPAGVAERMAAIGGDARVVGGAALSQEDAERVSGYLWDVADDVLPEEAKWDFTVDAVSGEVVGSLGVRQGHWMSFPAAVALFTRELGNVLPAGLPVDLNLRPMTVSEFGTSTVAFLPLSGDGPAVMLPATSPPAWGEVAPRMPVWEWGPSTREPVAAEGDVLPRVGL